MANDKLRRTILLVEDEALIAMNEASLLEGYGYNVITAVSAVQAIGAVQENDIDLILMDIDLGRDKMDGTEAAQIILKERDIPVIFLSNHTDKETVEKTEKITSYGYVVKSSNIIVLDTSIKMAFKLFDAKKEIEESEDKYRNLFTNMHAEVHLWKLIFDKEGAIKTWQLEDVNKAGLQAWNKTLAETIGRTTDEIWPDSNAKEHFMPIVQKIFEENKPHRWESYFPGTGQILQMTSVPFGDYFFSTGIDITDLKQSEVLLKSSIESPQDVIMLSIDKGYNYLYFNQVHSKSMIAAYNTEIEIGMNLLECITNEKDRDNAKINYDKALAGESHSTIQEFGETERSYYETRYNPILNEDGEIIGATAFASDITKRKQAEKEQVANTNLLMTLINNIPDAIFYKDLEGKYLLVNKAKMEQLGVKSAEEVIGKTVHDFFPKNQADIFTEIERQYLETEMPPHFWEEKVETLGGDHVWHYNTKILVRDPDDNPLGILTICRDITKEKSSEDNIKGLLAKNELLLKETHHRVKNYLNTILSLLSLQAESGDTPEVREKLQDAAGRVRGMMVLYDKLYRSDTFSEIGMTDFLPPLIDEIVGVFPSIPPVMTEVQVEEITLSSKILSPLGIIINELITNSMKYAFRGKDSGVISVTATQKDGRITIVYADNGVGLPESVDFENPVGFGMQLIQMLAAQIDGTVRIERHAGTKFVIEAGS